MNFRNKKIIIVSVIVSVMVLFLAIAFAALASNINISFGDVSQNALTWNVGFKGSSATAAQEGTSNTGLSCGTATITPSTVTISDTALSKPGDKCTYNLTIENKGDVSANLSSISVIEPTDTSCTKINNSTMTCGKITYKLTTISGSALTTGITINTKEEYDIKLVVTYSGEELNSTAVTQSNAKFTLTYTQAENRTGVAPEGVGTPKKCRRATKLHTEECVVNYDYYWDGFEIYTPCYRYGYHEEGSKNTTTMTFGSLGTSGVLNPGDAFDCDVNGDGEYDSETERFYYVSGLDGDDNSDYAVLLYYANISEGVTSYNSTYKYAADGNNYNGPVDAYLQLPTTSQWPNVSLIDGGKRQIYAEDGSTTTTKCNTIRDCTAGKIDLPTFTYTNRSARLLSAKELNKSCGTAISATYATQGELEEYCEYMLEHTSFSESGAQDFWLETPRSVNDYAVWFVSGAGRYVWGGNGASNSYGIRPAIEVKKSDISY